MRFGELLAPTVNEDDRLSRLVGNCRLVQTGPKGVGPWTEVECRGPKPKPVTWTEASA